jgi:hypothetical protein
MTAPYQKIARRMFDAYNGEGPNPWKTFDGRDVPRWDQLNDQVRGKWTAAAVAAEKLYLEEFSRDLPPNLHG